MATSAPTTTDDDLPVGQIRFVDNWVPPLTAGEYRVSVTHTVHDDASLGVAETYQHLQLFKVDGPRFTLAADDVHAALPPPNVSGNFAGTLPYIVLTKRSLPWERTLSGGTADPPPGTPWMALLVLERNEIVTVAESGTQLSATCAAVRHWTDVIARADSPVLGPTIALTPAEAADPSLRCLAIDVRTDAFLAVAPQMSEVKLLAHVRQVDTGGKEILGIDDDGWFAVVIANRWPAPAVAAGPDVKNYVHLVSLEGFGGWLPTGDLVKDTARLTGKSAVRLVSLASWAFTCQADVGDFGALVAKLDVARPVLPYQTPAKWGATPGAPEQIVLDGLAAGYVPVDYTTRLGEQTVSWYRGPLLPTPTTDVSLDAFFSAESGMIYDERTGMFDLSYALAWQIGRLLALSDQGFAKAVLNWRRGGEGGVSLLHERRALATRFGALFGDATDDAALLAPGAGNTLVKRFLATVLAPKTVPPAGPPLLGAPCDPSGVLDHLDRLPGVISPAALHAILDAGGDPIQGLRAGLRSR